MDDFILKIDGITKDFPGVRALDNVSFNIRRGEVHAIVGENGAGKSTLINIISGGLQPTQGIVYYNGTPIDFSHPVKAQRVGINVVHQELKMIGNLSVVENIYLGNLKTKIIAGINVIDWTRMKKEAIALLESLDFNIDVNLPIKSLSVSKQQIVEICRALAHDSQLIIMDEPSATLTDRELEVLFRIIRRLKKEGVTIIYISHRLNEVFEIGDAVTILRDGQLIQTCKTEEIDRKKLISLMVGRELVDEYPAKKNDIGEEVLRVDGITSKRWKLEDISFSLRRGEILGISGLVGAGRTELAKILFGAYSKDSGDISLRGQDGSCKNIRQAIKKKIALVPEDRKAEGLVLEMQVLNNISMVSFPKILTKHVISNRKEKELASHYIDILGISVPNIKAKTRNLSGGNQQKVVLAKWLAAESDVIIFDEPTRGIDVGAKAEIYKLMASLAEQGSAVIMISSEMPELMGMSDRIIVMHEGKLMGELNREDFSQERIMGMLAGDKEKPA
mgnify:CR=1 FL=1